MSPPPSGLRNKKAEKPAWNRQKAEVAYFTLVCFFPYCSALTIDATWSSETSADFQRTTRRYILEYSNLHINELLDC
jgi:hypothetical protein